MIQRWHLLVDESGNFDALDAPVLVAAYARRVRPGPRPSWDDRVLLKLRKLRGVPWPPHRTWLRIPVMFALWAHIEALDPAKSSVARYARTTIEALRESLPDVLTRALDRMREEDRARPEPEYQDARDLDRAARSHESSSVRAAWRGLQSISQQYLTYLDTAAQRALQGSTPGDGHAALMATEHEVGAGALTHDRYLTILAALLHRAADLLARTPGQHEVHVRPMQRLINSPLHPHRRSEMSLNDVAWAIAQATDKAEPGLHPSGRVSLLAGSAVEADEDMRPDMIMADLLANRLFPTLSRHWRLFEWRNRVYRRLQIPLWSGEPSLLHAGVTGPALAHTDMARDPSTPRNQLEVLTAPCDAPWMNEQAVAWSLALRDEPE